MPRPCSRRTRRLAAARRVSGSLGQSLARPRRCYHELAPKLTRLFARLPQKTIFAVTRLGGMSAFPMRTSPALSCGTTFAIPTQAIIVRVVACPESE